MSDKQSAEEWLESTDPCAHETPICSNPLCVDGYVLSDECFVCGGPIYRRDCPQCRKQALDMRAAEERERWMKSIDGMLQDVRDEEREKAADIIKQLLLTANHEPTCRFTACSCGNATKHSNAQLEAGRWLRAIAKAEGQGERWKDVAGAALALAKVAGPVSYRLIQEFIAKVEGGEPERIKMGALKDKLPPGNLPRTLSVPIDEEEEGGEG